MSPGSLRRQQRRREGQGFRSMEFSLRVFRLPAHQTELADVTVGERPVIGKERIVSVVDVIEDAHFERDAQERPPQPTLRQSALMDAVAVHEHQLVGLRAPRVGAVGKFDLAVHLVEQVVLRIVEMAKLDGHHIPNRRRRCAHDEGVIAADLWLMPRALQTVDVAG